jgi:hypothetical protein
VAYVVPLGAISLSTPGLIAGPCVSLSSLSAAPGAADLGLWLEPLATIVWMLPWLLRTHAFSSRLEAVLPPASKLIQTYGEPAGQSLPAPGLASTHLTRPWMAGLIGV